MDQPLQLSEIPGLGPVRRAALAEAGVSDLHGLLAMKVAELAEVRGIGIWQARKIREFLRQRGLLVEEDPQDPEAVLVAEPRTPEQVVAVMEAGRVLEAQAEEESELEAEVDELAEAVSAAESAAADGRAEEQAGADRGAASEAEEGPTMGAPTSISDDERSGSRGEPQSRSGDEAVDWSEQISAQRAQLPDTALALMDAIRQAAVSQQLTRQITRLLIIAGEFVGGPWTVSDKQRRQACEILGRADEALRQAIEKRAFAPDEQKELAQRIRKRRKDLERLLERERASERASERE